MCIDVVKLVLRVDVGYIAGVENVVDVFQKRLALYLLQKKTRTLETANHQPRAAVRRNAAIFELVRAVDHIFAYLPP